MTKEEIILNAIEALNITSLNSMQNEVIDRWQQSQCDLIVYSPTGSGKSLAFLIPVLLSLKTSKDTLQAVIIEPSRELATQTFAVLKKIAPLTKAACCYGGHDAVIEKRELESHPMVIVATPGRLLDHINRKNPVLNDLSCLVLDEFDKSLELGFAHEMQQIMFHCPSKARKILTSATQIQEIPKFLSLNNCHTINYITNLELNEEDRFNLWNVKSSSDNDKLNTLVALLYSIPDEQTIVFSSTRECAQQVHNYLLKKKLDNVLYHGTLEQIEREKAVAMFNNGTVMVMVATDLASRGLDITTVKHIIHYDLPLTQEIFIHRNGRTARYDSHGDVYLITTPSESLPPYADGCKVYEKTTDRSSKMKVSNISTLHISAGRKEKISRGDVVGFIASHATMITASEIGKINIYDHHCLVAVPKDKTTEIINAVSPFKLKKLKVKVSLAQPRLRFAKSTNC